MNISHSKNSFISSLQQRELPFGEFIALMAMMMSLVALSIDAVLPALGVIGSELNIENTNNQQLIIGFVFLGMAFGQLLFGPWSDSVGRRKAMLFGYLVFFAGTALSLYSTDLNDMLISRLLQGFGMAAPKVLSTAIVRDLYSGRAMARVMSFVMVIFILVPMLAPIFGQLMLTIANWQAIFLSIAAIGVLSLSWYLLRQGETLSSDHQAKFTFSRTKHAITTIVKNPKAIGNTLAVSLISGPFIFYLGSSQQLFQVTYELGDNFPYYFAFIALAIGLASFVNGKKVMQHGMLKILTLALSVIITTSVLFLSVVWLNNGLPALWLTTIYMFITFFCLGLTFGNFNALAMEPLGKIAGIGAAFIGALSTFVGSLLSMFIGSFFNDTLYPLVISFMMAGILALITVRTIDQDK